MQWEIVYLSADIEVTHQHLCEFVKDCINYKWLDLLLKIVNKCKRPLAKYVVHQGFWEDKIKHWRCQKNGNVLLLNKNETNKQIQKSTFFFSLKCVHTIVAVPCTIQAEILVTILNIVQFVSLVRMTASMVCGTSTTNVSVITVIYKTYKTQYNYMMDNPSLYLYLSNRCITFQGRFCVAM